MTMRNAEQWLDESLSSLYNQTYTGHMELSVYNDGSMVRLYAHYNNSEVENSQSKALLLLSPCLDIPVIAGDG